MSRTNFNVLIVLIVLSALLGLYLSTNQAKAQSWTETVSYTDAQGNTRYCTITYVNGGRQRYVACN